jgi:hypothetical protein
MNEFMTFIELGFRHIVDIEAMDHILFLMVLAAIYRLHDARRALWVITAFTVGHSITLALAVTGTLHLRTDVIEFLIPVTIVLTAIENLVVSARDRAGWQSRYRPVLAGTFGLVHGAGFANYLQSLFVERVAVPLFGFNVGIEAGQIVVLVAAALVLTGVDRLIDRSGFTRLGWTSLRLRTIGVSAMAGVVATLWAVQRSPW